MNKKIDKFSYEKGWTDALEEIRASFNDTYRVLLYKKEIKELGELISEGPYKVPRQLGSLKKEVEGRFKQLEILLGESHPELTRLRTLWSL